MLHLILILLVPVCLVLAIYAVRILFVMTVVIPLRTLLAWRLKLIRWIEP
jgi:hypothetical protein